MKKFWVLGPSPFKSSRSINAIIYENIIRAQEHVGEPLTRQQIAGLIKMMKDKGIFKSKQDRWSLFNNFIASMKQYKLVQDQKPESDE